MADLHTHVVPGVDDGAQDLDSAIDTLRSLADDGITAVAGTPHLNASRPHGSRRARAKSIWPELVERARSEVPDIELHAGFEIALDTPEVDLGDEDLRLSGTRFALVEFFAFTIPENSAVVMAGIRSAGYVPIIAHPERYWGYDRDYSVVSKWREAGALLQINSGSLFGEYGDHVKMIAHRLLTEGSVDLIASDNHARAGRSPSIREAWDYLSERGFTEQAALLLSTNPQRILRDEMPLAVGRLHCEAGFFARVARALRGGR